MARATRLSQLPYHSEQPIQGLFVVGRSSARGQAIPHLPVLARKGEHQDATAVSISPEDYDGRGVLCPSLFETFAEGDIVYLDAKNKRIRSILAKAANANTVLVTEQCDNRCLFCSQPPNELPDSKLYENAALSILNFNSSDMVGVSGGEPTINRHGFLNLLRALEEFHSPTPLHILSNGRALSDVSFLAELEPFLDKRKILWGIPLYGYLSEMHDTLVGSPGAFIETVDGILNLQSVGQPTELRIVPVKDNYKSLGNIVRFVVQHIPKIAVISIMQLEPTGWARHRYNDLFVPSREQSDYIDEAASIASDYGIEIRLFNYPLCHLPELLRPLACQSISDWKNYFPPPCSACQARDQCAGFFTSATGRFVDHVEPLK